MELTLPWNIQAQLSLEKERDNKGKKIQICTSSKSIDDDNTGIFHVVEMQIGMKKFDHRILALLNPFPSKCVLRALIDFTLSNARRFYSSMGNLLDRKGLSSS